MLAVPDILPTAESAAPIFLACHGKELLGGGLRTRKGLKLCLGFGSQVILSANSET